MIAASLREAPPRGIVTAQYPCRSTMSKPVKKLFRQLGFVSSAILFHPVGRFGNWLITLQNRERAHMLKEMSQMRGLLRLLMKQRNGYRWTDDERQQIREHLRSLAKMSPYVALFLMPGGLLLLPIMTWWLDRRRQKRIAEAQRLRDEL